MVQSTIVIFTCPNCDQCYRSHQQRSLSPVSGKFECLECKTLVHEWGGRYDYADWRFEPQIGLRVEK
jgi:hypothetical protein